MSVLILKERGLLVPHPLVAVTLMVPLVKPIGYLNDIEFVPWPVTFVTFNGNVQLNAVAPIAEVVYVAKALKGPIYWQAFLGPMIKEGVSTEFLVMDKLLVELEPQLFVALTFKLPEVNDEENVISTIVSFTPIPAG